MYKLQKEEMGFIQSLFENCEDTLVWSCLQGYMGEAWVDEKEYPTAAKIITGDFCFLVGEPHEELVKHIPDTYAKAYLLIVPENKLWAQLIEKVYGGHASAFMRYAIRLGECGFDVKRLQANIDQLSEEYQLQAIDEQLYFTLKGQEWSEDFCSQFTTYEIFKEQGMGFVILHQGEPVSGASSYTVFDKGIEIEIDTQAGYRRRGLALVCASKIILECLKRGIDPHWDAANKASVALAEKLGYCLEKEYVTYEVSTQR